MATAKRPRLVMLLGGFAHRRGLVSRRCDAAVDIQCLEWPTNSNGRPHPAIAAYRDLSGVRALQRDRDILWGSAIGGGWNRLDPSQALGVDHSIVLSTLALATFVVSRLGFVALAMTGRGGEVFWLSLILGTVILCYPQVVHPLLTFAILLPQSMRQVFLQPIRQSLTLPTRTCGSFVRAIKRTVPVSRQQLDETVRQGFVGGSSEIWQADQAAVWAQELYPHLGTDLLPD